MDVLQAACTHLGITVDQVLSHRVYPDRIALVVDRGIKGCPKYVVGLAELESEEETDGQVDRETSYPHATVGQVLPPDNTTGARVVITDPPATEMARTMAKQSRIELVMVEGTGAGGRITKRDVKRAIAARKEG